MDQETSHYIARYFTEKIAVLIIDTAVAPPGTFVPGSAKYAVIQVKPPFNDYDDVRYFTQIKDAEADFQARIPVRKL